MRGKPWFFAFALMCCALLWSSQPASAGFLQQGPKLVGTAGPGAAEGAQQGVSVAVSADGNTAIVGGPFANCDAGAAWVFTRSGGVWTQQGSLLLGTGYGPNPDPNQGWSVALSGDGNTAILGGPLQNNGVGAAWVFTRSGSVWSQQAMLVADDEVGNADFGYSVALSSDGNTAIVGGPYDDNGMTSSIGAGWVFTRSGSVWNQQGSKLTGTGYVGTTPYQGYSVGLSADGNTALLGGWGDNSAVGAAWVFTRSGSVWSQQGSKLTGTGEVGAADLAWSVGLSGDGNTAILGGPFDNSFAGAAWVFTRSGGVWSQQGSKLVGNGAAGLPTYQGYSVALSNQNTAILGGHSDNEDVGAAWVFARRDGVWTQLVDRL